MGVRIGWWTVDVQDAQALARFYEELLGWPRLFEDPDEGVALVPAMPPTPGQGMLLYAHHGSGPKQVKNRAHLDLRPTDQAAAVARALSLGATPVDLGQRQQTWEVLADPEGNEFCLLSSGDGDGPNGIGIDAWVLDANDKARVAAFWQTFLAWDEAGRDADSVLLRDPAGSAPDLLIAQTDQPKTVKNRVHPDIVPDGTRGDELARPREVQRALDLGATPADIGQGDVGWTVMADPEGNEFCVLAPGILDGPPPT